MLVRERGKTNDGSLFNYRIRFDRGVTRCIHIALLCIQEDNKSRPHMSSVVDWLNTRSNPSDNPTTSNSMSVSLLMYRL
ncbi:hypothetical protein HanRHA438_Chr13g0617231 [Helianthus annuus]|uniref:Uncharacterized protein n=1 Tax=Helianthus annuus TaxID=4232 RepID=A0A9K3EL36_HELAN|nr:hypothetical protein HanXRQr2_Chr13g0606951 [Helianthus annuus]KAJ0478202.1 hypothetical protein HanHA300_Chr13g0497611 [Helianthus annuus]KAJ0499086.1 hypothetical protein HanHA89_Chr13g0530281 [Helianthus annuus]KAJ0665100.1 hypothetical protein HanLR1_Chr13g0500311 [Helianthus annuus]KAJ0672518.1 hypothetical protein HanOQP8_Chr13g0498251 [Helianthus annuus]